MIDPSRIFTWVHTWHGRSSTQRAATLASLEASDASGRYQVSMQPENTHRDDYYMDTLRAICDRTDTDYMLRLEDDVLVNKFLLHNVSKWSAPAHPRFGAGWLSTTRGLMADTTNCPTLDGFRIREYKECFFAGGVLMKLDVLRDVLPLVEVRLRAGGKDFSPGCALSNAVWRKGLRVFFHLPSIVAIDMNIPAYHARRPEENDFDHQPYAQNWKA